MIDVDETLRLELERLLPAVAGPDWAEVVRLAGPTPERRRRRSLVLAVCVAAVSVVAVVSLATPLGATIVHGLGGFSSWISGEPGKPAPQAEQRAFARANAHSFLGFPAGTKLRLLSTVRQRSSGRSVQLLGFRAGGTLCLRLVVTAPTPTSRQSCAPLGELRHAGAPVRVVMVDDGFGQGHKRVWYGIDRFGAPALQVTAGIAADGVRSVVVHDQAGTHSVPARANAFLYVAWDPGVGQRVDAISALTRHGRVDVPFAPAPWGGGGIAGTTAAAPGPTKVQRRLHSGTIAWLTRHEPVGEPLTKLRGRAGTSLRRGLIFGRLLDPNPSVPARFALTLANNTPGGRLGHLQARGPIVCGWTISGSGAGGGCSPLKGLFAQGPIVSGSFLANGSDEFMLVSGFVSDDVHRLLAYLSSGGTQRLRIVHNAFLVSLARARFPVRLVAYDRQGRIVGNSGPLTDIGGGAGPAPGRAKPLLHATSPSGATATLLVGRSNQGGACWYVRWYQSRFVQGASVGCTGRAWRGNAVQLGGGGPVGIWYGRVRPEVTRVVATFADGRRATIRPTDGFVLWSVPAAERGKSAWVRRFTGYDGAGRVVGSDSLPRPPPRRR